MISFFKFKKKKLTIELKHLAMIWLSDDQLMHQYKKDKFEIYKNDFSFKKETIQKIWDQLIKNYLNINFVSELDTIEKALSFFDKENIKEKDLTFISNLFPFIENLNFIHAEDIVHSIIAFLYYHSGQFLEKYTDNPLQGSLVFFERICEKQKFFQKISIGIAGIENLQSGQDNSFAKEVNRAFFKLNNQDEFKDIENINKIEKSEITNKNRDNKEKKQQTNKIWEAYNPTETDALLAEINFKKQPNSTMRQFIPDKYVSLSIIKIILKNIQNNHLHFFVYGNTIYIKHSKLKFFFLKECGFNFSSHTKNDVCLNFFHEESVLFEKQDITIYFEKITKARQPLKDTYLIIDVNEKDTNLCIDSDICINNEYKIKKIEG